MAPIDSVTKRELLILKIPPRKIGTQHKWHLTKIAFYNYIIGLLKYYQHPVNRTYSRLLPHKRAQRPYKITKFWEKIDKFITL